VIEQHDRALAAATELADRAAQVGSLVATLTAGGTRGYVLCRRGELRESEAELRKMLAMVSEAGMPLIVTTAIDFFQDAILERPSLDDLAAAVGSMQLEREFLATWGGAMLLGVRGRLRLAQGERNAGIEDLGVFADTCGALRFGPLVSAWRSMLALALPADEHTEALALIDEEVELARATELPRPYGIALRAAGVFSGGDAGVDLLRASVQTLECSAARLELARSLVELGALLRRRNHRADARGQLPPGWSSPTAAVRCGSSSGPARSCERRARVRGGSPRPGSTH
jgi:hypothetical protein